LLLHPFYCVMADSYEYRQKVEKLVKEFEHRFPNEYDRPHARRYAESYLTIFPYLTDSTKILEVGGSTGFAGFIGQKHPAVKISNTSVDLRHEFTEKSDVYDFLLNMEVLEHIKDREDGCFHSFDFSGVKSFLSECYRVLRPGGTMFLTTPNSHNLVNIARILELKQPIFFKPHVREYGAVDTKDMLVARGFKIKLFETRNVWLGLGKEKYDWLKSIAMSCGGNPALMGEDTFILAEK
jgi:SAM-dependent methyltransferase